MFRKQVNCIREDIRYGFVGKKKRMCTSFTTWASSYFIQRFTNKFYTVMQKGIQIVRGISPDTPSNLHLELTYTLCNTSKLQKIEKYKFYVLEIKVENLKADRKLVVRYMEVTGHLGEENDILLRIKTLVVKLQLRIAESALKIGGRRDIDIFNAVMRDSSG